MSTIYPAEQCHLSSHLYPKRSATKTGAHAAAEVAIVRHKRSFIADQRGAAALEMPAVCLFIMMILLVPLADLAIAGFRLISAHQALRDMGQRTQYSMPDATDSNSLTNWK